MNYREQFEDLTGYSNRDDDKYMREYITWLETRLQKAEEQLEAIKKLVPDEILAKTAG